jgi:hypothetical protein
LDYAWTGSRQFSPIVSSGNQHLPDRQQGKAYIADF